MRALATIPVVLVLAIWSLATTFVDAVGRPVVELASRVEADTRRDFRYLGQGGHAPAARAGLAVCSRPAVRGVVSLTLAELDVAYRGEDASTRAATLADADLVLRDAIRCFPYDGNLWLRSAMVAFARAGATTRVEEMLALSASTAPSAAWIIAPRIVFASTLLETGSAAVRAVLERDMHVFVARAHYAEVGKLYLEIGDEPRQILEDSVASLETGERQVALQRTLAAAVKMLPPERQP
jgi:hypothetical protein